MNAYEKELNEKEYEEKLDEIFGDVTICGMQYSSGHALKMLDPIAFRCGMADEPIVWVCDECDSEFETEEEANECCMPEC